MDTIYKYELQITSAQNIEMPIGAQILSVGDQENRVFVWALIDDEADNEKRHFELITTGSIIEPVDVGKRAFIGTFQFSNVGFVGHVFERLA